MVFYRERKREQRKETMKAGSGGDGRRKAQRNPPRSWTILTLAAALMNHGGPEIQSDSRSSAFISGSQSCLASLRLCFRGLPRLAQRFCASQVLSVLRVAWSTGSIGTNHLFGNFFVNKHSVSFRGRDSVVQPCQFHDLVGLRAQPALCASWCKGMRNTAWSSTQAVAPNAVNYLGCHWQLA